MGGPSSSEVKQQQQSWANLNSLFQTAADTAKNFGSSGQGTLDQVTKFFQGLFTRQGAMQGAAPAINSAKQGETAARKQDASMGTSRSGGTAAGNQTRSDQTRAQIDSLVGSEGPMAASALSSLGAQEVNSMLSALGISTSAASTVGSETTSDINSQRQATADMWSSLIGGASKIAAAAIPFNFGTSSPGAVPKSAGAADIYGPDYSIAFG